MIKSAVTISLVPEARGGPFVFWDDLAAACRKAAGLGFDGVEVFAPDATSLGGDLRILLDDHGLGLAAAGTGAGWVKHRLTLTSADAGVRQRAKDFIRSIIDAAGALGAPAIVGSMQGRWGDGVGRTDAYRRLADALGELGRHARGFNVPLLFEPLNRYETNIVNDLSGGAALLGEIPDANVKLLADLFHMNIEEGDLAEPFRVFGEHVGHVHLADSNRRAAGAGHTDFGGVAASLKGIGYGGYLSAEVLPLPDPDAAAKLTIETFRRYFR